MTETPSSQKITKVQQQDSPTMQTLSKKIPQHRRSMHQIEAQGTSYQRLIMKQDLSRRLNFEPFGYSRKIPVDQEVKHIAKILGTSSKIIDTVISLFDMTLNERDKTFLRYSEEIKKMRGLKTLDFYLSGSEITDLALRDMSLGFKSLRSLQYLRIRFVECSYIDDASIVYVAKGLKKLTSLKTLDLSSDGDPRQDRNITDEGIKVLVKNLKYLKNLQTLNLSFYSDGGIDFEEVGDVAKAMQGLKFLKNIALNFSLAEEMGIEGIKNINKMLEVLPDLESIDLRLWDCNIEDQELKVLMKGFRGKEHLKKIRLDIGNNQITDEGLVKIAECFKKLKVIKEIKLDIECEEVTDEGKDLLKKSLKKIASLQRLELVDET